ncbi:MAG: sortase [Anaerolineales bacterium]|nr:sortase [Anaerolineales bacterium]
MSRSFQYLFLALVMIGSLFLGPATPAYAASLPAEINQQFTPLQIDAGGTSILRITIFNPNVYGLTSVAWTNNLTTGLYVAPGAIVNTCGGTFAPLPGDTTLTMSGGSVAPQVTVPGECYVEVPISSITPGNIINVINVGALTATGDEGGITNTSPASATITVIEVKPPSLSKTFAPNTIYVGQTSRMTIRINNNDNDTDLTNVSFTDNLPAGVILATPAALTTSGCGAGALITAADGGGVVSLSAGTVAPSVDCLIAVTVTGNSGAYTNTIPAGPTDPASLKTQQGVYNSTDVEADLNIQPVNVTKLFSPVNIDAGDTSTLTITLQNPTNANYTNVAITDSLLPGAPGLTFTGTPTTTCGSGVVTFTTATTLQMTGGTIPPRPTPTTLGTCTITATVQSSLTSSGAQTNTIPKDTLTADQPGVTNIFPASAGMTIRPALTATKSFAAPYIMGLDGSYTNTVTIQLSNNSNTTLTGINFTDSLPAGLLVSGSPVSPQCGGTITSTTNSITLASGTIAPNSSCSVIFNVSSTTAGVYSNTIDAGTITSGQGPGVGTNTTTPRDLTVVNAPFLPVNVAKAFSPSSTLGTTSRLTITITAPADLPINGIHFTDTLPAGMNIATTPNAATTCPGGLGALTLNTVADPDQVIFNDTTLLTTLAAGANCTISVDVEVTPGLYTNTIPVNDITTQQGRTNELTATSALLSATTLTTRKAFYPIEVQANGRSVLTITLQNESPSDLINVNITDNLPGDTTNGLVVYSPVNAVTTCGAGTITISPDFKTIQLTGGTVPAKLGSVPGICTITVDVQGKDTSPSSASTYTNTIPVGNTSATVSATGSVVQALQQAQADLTVKNLEIGIVKGFSPVLVYGGATSTMTVQLINPNATQLTGVAFTDNMDLLYLPGSSGIKLANPPMLNTGTCGGTLVGNPGDAQFSFSGGVLQPFSSCTITLRVIMNVNGNRTNRIPAGALTTANGVTSDEPTEASLTNLPGVGVVKVFNPNPVAVNQVSKLTITISNTSNVPVREMGLLDEFPTLPDGLVIASGPDYLATHTCIDPAAPVTTTTLTAVAGTGTIQLTGGSLAARGDPGGKDICKVEINVVSTEIGAYVNVIPVGGITATGGVQNINSTTDTLRVGGLFSLGNRVWFDTNNDGDIDTDEVGVDGVVVQLFEADAGGNPTVLRGTQTTSGGGYYRFDDLEPNNFVVVIPDDNFKNVVGDIAPLNRLSGYWSSGTTIAADGTTTDATANDPDDDLDSDENGLTQLGGDVISDAITIGPPGPAEPTNDDDMPLANPAGESPDDRSNRTVDFGFYKLSLGSLVFMDSDGNGVYDGSNTPISGATVQLFASDGATETEINTGPDGILGTIDDAAGGVTTGAAGTYLFQGLPQGTYLVKVNPPGDYSSTVDSNPQNDNDDPDTNIDNNDNGVGIGSGLVESELVTLVPGDAGANSKNIITTAIGDTYDPTVDFGFVLYSLGNRVWYDTDNDGVLDGAESGISGVRVELYRGATFIGYTETDSTGYYRFDDLPAGDYVVVIPGDNFRNVGAGDNMGSDPLAGYWSTGISVNGTGTLSESATNDPDNDRDAVSGTSDENGVTTFLSTLLSSVNPIDYVSSAPITLGGLPLEPTGEPSSASGQGSTDNHANMTVDFGFYRAAIGDLVFADFTEDGDLDGSPDGPLAGATVQLFMSNGTTEIPVGPDGIIGTSDDALGGVTTLADGLYSFIGLPSGDYIVKVTPPAGYYSTRDDNPQNDNDDPDQNANNNDNGVGTALGQASSAVLTLNPSTDSGANITKTNATGTTTDSSLDFGFISPYYSLGNRVWFDTNNNNLIDTATEVGVSGVRVQLFNSSGTEINVGPDGILNSADDAAGGMLTAAGGYYRFDNLPAGDYVVVIPNDNFTTGGNTSLVGYWSSGTLRAANGTLNDNTANDVDIDEDDSDENGVTTFDVTGTTINFVSSSVITLGPPPLEPMGETDIDGTRPLGAIDERANLTADFGFYRTVIGNLVFADLDRSGANNAGDTPLSGANVQLYSADGVTLLATTTSAASTGLYSFTGQPQGDYIVRVTPPVGYEGTIDTNPQTDNDEPDNNVDNNDNGDGVLIDAVVTSSGVLTMTPGGGTRPDTTAKPNVTITNSSGSTTDNTMDFGFVPLVFSLGNRVWYDTDNNSLMDGAEVGINGVRVELYRDTNNSGGFNAGDTFLAFDTTDTNGYYRFDDLPAGNYVVVIADDNFRTLASGDTVPGNPLLGYRSSATSIISDGTITDATANDPDADQDDLDDNGLTTALASGGIDYVASAAITLGPGAQELITDNDPSTNPESADGEEPNNQSDRTVDFGFYRLDLGNIVFVDVDKSGDRNAGDTLLSGANVVLYSGNNNTQIQVGADGILGTTDDGTGAYVTGAGGTYSFSGLPAGDYVVRVTPPSTPIEYASTVDTADSGDTTDPDTNTDENDNGIGENALQVSSGVVTLTPGQGTGGAAGAANNVVTNATATTSDPTVDFGFIVPVYNLGNRVWFDTDNDGVLDAGEQGVSGVRVELYSDTNNNQTYNPGTDLPVAASPFTTTDSTGYYRFDGLPAGNYIVVIPNDNFTTGGTTDALVGYWSTGTTIANNSNRSDSTSNDPDNDVDAGLPTSDENGRTTFISNRFINYVAAAAVTLGATAEPLNEVDLSATGQGTTYDNRANMTVDFGFYRVEIGDLVYVDEDGDGIYNSLTSDSVMSNAIVQLYTGNNSTEVTVGPDGILGTTDDAAGGVTTGAGGTYSFKNLPAGNYIIRVTPPSGYISTIDSNPQNDNDDPDINTDNNDNGDGTGPGQVNSGALTMSAGEVRANIALNQGTGTTTDNTLDFGFTKVYSLGNRVWYDTDNDSILDTGESGVNNVLVQLYRDTDASGTFNAGDTSVTTVNTDANGYYRFDNLAAGNYVVVIPNDNFVAGGTTDALLGYWSSGTLINSSGVPSDATPTAAFTANNDSDSDTDENGVTTFSGNTVNYVASTAVTLGAETEPTTDNDPATNPQAGEAPNNRSNRTLDFGFYNVAIGNLVFVDVDTSGAYNGGDTLLSGATVQLYAENGTTTIGSSVTTGPAGTYSFTGLPAGNYIVKVTPPTGYASAIDTNPQTDNDNPDNNDNDNDNGVGLNSGIVSSNILTMTPGGGTTPGGSPKTVTIANGTTTDNTLDFGFNALLFSLGNRVWYDTDNDGVIDAGEDGISGVRVEVYRDTNASGAYDAGDTIAGNTTTDVNGYYRFDSLTAGEYVVLLPGDNFRNIGLGDNVAGDPLAGYWSTGTTVSNAGVLSESATNDPDNNVDAGSNPLTSEENGLTTFTSTALSNANPLNYVSSRAITIGPATDEPTGESDLVSGANPQGNLDNRANMTVDFGFYRVGIGNLIFMDDQIAGVSDGEYVSASGDQLLGGATVELLSADGATVLRSMVTTASGVYSFPSLPQGNYVVRVTPPAGYASTVDTVNANDTTDPDYNTDNNDNGPGTAIGAVTSGILTMTPGSGTTPLSTAKTLTVANGTTTDNSVDFGFNSLTFSLGNRVWFDTNNDGNIDANENGVSGARVELYKDTNPNGVYDALDTSAGFTTTNASGYYRFDGLSAGDYVVVLPNDNFTSGGTTDVLLGYWSSGTSRADNGSINETATNDPDTNSDSDVDENGATTFSGSAINYVASTAVTLGPATNEPTSEGDLSSTGQGNLDNRANMTVDFGFYQVSIGNLIFVDAAVNGTYGAGDTELDAATVTLLAGNGTTSLGSVTTGANGIYSFTGLPEGNYIVRVTPPNGYVSTVDLGSTPNPNNNTDSDDNGPTENVPGAVTSGTLVMDAGEFGDSPAGLTTDLTVDFGFKSVYSLGNRVWFDTNNDGVLQNGTEVGVNGVLVELYRDTNTNNQYDSGTDTLVTTDTTDVNGYYRFDNLEPGSYLVVIPSDNFVNNASNNALVGYWSSRTTRDDNGNLLETTAPSPENNTDLDDNGTRISSGDVVSTAVVLGPGMSEPINDNDPGTNPESGEAVNNQSNRTVDFGFYRVAVSNQLFVDVDDNGAYDASVDFPLPSATVDVLNVNSLTVYTSTTTNASGIYTITGLPQGNYILRVSPPAGFFSARDIASVGDTNNPNNNIDNNDNGVGTAAGVASSKVFALDPTAPASLEVVDNSTGTTTDPTLDFGFTFTIAKAFIDGNAAHTTVTTGGAPAATIGEQLIYEITLLVPSGTLNNVTVVDTPQTGLAFMDCIELDLPAGVTSTTLADGTCNTLDGAAPGSNPLVANNGGLVTFDFGALTNATLQPKLVTIRYSLIVLDILSNQGGNQRTNSVVWNYSGNSQTVSANPVTLVEPEMTINKTATPVNAPYNSIITFTIDVAHSSQSSADAFDVVITDEIPVGLQYVPGSAVVSGTAVALPPSIIGTTLTVRWNEFQLGRTGRVTFDAIFVGPAPVVNSANVEWTSLEIDPAVDNVGVIPDVPVQISPYNVNGTERWYDPSAPAGVNSYAVVSTVAINLPPPLREGPGKEVIKLPATGFAPGRVTYLPDMPEDFAYAQTDLWVEIPSMGAKLNIVGVPFDEKTGEWDLRWLASSAGWLENTAYPTFDGNSVITAHTSLASGLKGPFANLNTLKYGDQIIVHLGGQKYIYEVRTNSTVQPTAVSSVLKHEDKPWLTLITCKTFDEASGEYLQRTVVRAVLTQVIDE